MVDYLKAYAEEIYTDTEFKDKCKNYDHAQPFTKESLLYREIFEEYCHVNDPSARVLSNYGDSGI